MLLLRRLFHGREQKKFLMIGLDAAGRTTSLYRFATRSAMAVSPIPTIGFNHEVFQHGAYDVAMWEVGGGDRIRALWKHYFNDLDVLCFTIDSSDTARFAEAIDELHRVLQEPDLPPRALIVAMLTKCDIGEIRKHQVEEHLRNDAASELQSRTWAVFETSARTGEGIDDMLDWCVAQFQCKSPPSSCNASRTSTPQDESDSVEREQYRPATLSPRMRAILERTIALKRSKALPDEEFLAAFGCRNGKSSPSCKGNLSSFNSLDVIRLAFLLHRRGLMEGWPIFRVTESLVSALGEYCARQALQSSAHVSAWHCLSHLVHYNMMEVLSAQAAESPSAAGGISGTAIHRAIVHVERVGSVSFVDFIEQHIELLAEETLLLFYSPKVYNSDRAKRMFVQPDIRPFPSTLREGAPLDGHTSSQLVEGNLLLADTEFLWRYQNGTLAHFDEESLVRLCYLTLIDSKQRGERRGATVKRLLDELQVKTIQLRARLIGGNGATPSPRGVGGGGAASCGGGGIAGRGIAGGEAQFDRVTRFSHTVTYFWIQVIDYALSLVSLSTGSGGDAQFLTFLSFIRMFPELRPSERLWRRYYSEHVFYGLKAAREFVAPDIAPIENVLQGRTVEGGAGVGMSIASPRPQPGALLELYSLVSKRLVCSSEPTDHELLEALQARRVALCHISFLRVLFITYQAHLDDRPSDVHGAASASLSVLQHYWEVSSGGEASSTAVVTYPSSTLSAECMFRDCTATDRAVLSTYPGITYVLFWIRVMGSAIGRAVIQYVTDGSGRRPQALTLLEVLRDHPELMWSHLHTLHYSDEACFSAKSRVALAPPDRAPLSAA